MTFVQLCAFCVLSVLPRIDRPVIDRVEIIERNFFYDENGRLVFEQIIGWEKGRVRFWILDNHQKSIEMERLKSGGVLRFDEGPVFREIWCTTFAETYTQYDPELVDRDVLPREQRMPLSTRKKPAKCPSIMPR